MKRILILSILIVCSATKVGATDLSQYFEKINQNYNDLNAFELTLNYKLFKGHIGSELRDEYQSVLKMTGANSHRKLYQDEIITTARQTVVLNHDARTIQIMPPVEEGLFDMDVEKSIKQCKDIQITKTATGELITILLKKGATVNYSQIEIEIDAQFWVKKITLYYTNQMNFSQDYFNPEVAMPRLEIEYQKLKKNWKDKAGLANLSTYLIKEGEFYTPTKNYNGYEIIQ